MLFFVGILIFFMSIIKKSLLYDKDDAYENQFA
jgi:hypothetical protein